MSRRKRTQFWGLDENDDRLLLEVISGHKTATACKADEYDMPMGEFDDGGMAVGDLVDVHDLKGRLRCVIRVTEVYLAKFGDIPEKLWRGENCADAGHFRDEHRKCWPDYSLTDDFEIMATHFELVEVHEETPPPVPHPVNIREMSMDDYDAVIALMRATPGISVREADSRDAIARYLERNPGLSFVAIAEDGSVAGCIMCGHDGRRGYPQHLVVSESRRRQGVGTALVERCLAALKAVGILKAHIHVFATNQHAISYWQGRGWRRRDDTLVFSFTNSDNPNV